MVRKEKVKKVAIIGAGFVGASIAYALACSDYEYDIALIDIDKDKAIGEAADIRHGISSLSQANVYAGDYSDCRECGLIIITAGRNRKPGETRLDLAADNIRIMKNIVDSIKNYYNGCSVMIVSNPVDILTMKCCEWLDIKDGRVFGSGCILDTSRFVRNLADYFSVEIGDVDAFIAGEHGDAQIPVWSNAFIKSLLIDDYCKQAGIEWGLEQQELLAAKTRQMGAEIIKNKGRTQYGITACVLYLADAVFNNRRITTTVCTPLQGEYGIEGVTLSLPSVIGKNGVEKRIADKLNMKEISLLKEAAQKLKNALAQLEDALSQ